MSRPSTERFSDRVADYVRARPSYPPEALSAFGEIAGLRPGSIVADIGAGTGISTALLLDRGWKVMAVEPNDAMRQAMDRQLADRSGFSSVAGTAEATGLPEASVDAIFAAQAFHWFDPEAAGREFRRILRRPGHVGLIWNTRSLDASPFSRAYERLLTDWGTDYAKIRHRNLETQEIHAFLGEGVDVRHFQNRQELDLEGLTSRLLSSSYTPAADSPRRAPMLEDMRRIFEEYREDGHVTLFYDCELHVARWS